MNNRQRWLARGGWLLAAGLVIAVALDAGRTQRDGGASRWRRLWDAVSVRLTPLFLPRPAARAQRSCATMIAVPDAPPLVIPTLPEPLWSELAPAPLPSPTAVAARDRRPMPTAARATVHARPRPMRAVWVAPRGDRSATGDDDGSVYLDGTLDASVFAREIGRRRGALAAAYRRALRRDPWTEGELRLRFTIDESGRVAALGVESTTIRDAIFVDEVTRAAASWRFPSPPGGPAHYAVPLRFNAPTE